MRTHAGMDCMSRDPPGPVGAMILDAKYCEFCGCTSSQSAIQRQVLLQVFAGDPTLNARKAEKPVSQLIH